MTKINSFEICVLCPQPYRTTPLILPGAKISNSRNLPIESYLRHHPNPQISGPPAHDFTDTLMKQKVADSVLQKYGGEEPKANGSKVSIWFVFRAFHVILTNNPTQNMQTFVTARVIAKRFWWFCLYTILVGTQTIQLSNRTLLRQSDWKHNQEHCLAITICRFIVSSVSIKLFT